MTLRPRRQRMTHRMVAVTGGRSLVKQKSVLIFKALEPGVM
jgi:hypothetical protein